MVRFRAAVSLSIALSCAPWALAARARAADQGITGKMLLLKASQKVSVLSKDSSIDVMGADPVGGSNSSITFDDGTHMATLSLPASNWSTNGSRSVFQYKNASAPSGPSIVKIAKVKSGLLKVTGNGLPIPVPNGSATINVVLKLDGGANTYCMTFAGTGDGTKFAVKDSPAGACAPAATPTPTVTPTPTPRLPDIPPPGATPLRYRDPVFADVTTTSNVTYGSAVDNSGQTVTLQLDTYEPTGDTVTARPAIVWVHGGSFCCGDKTSPELVDEATTFSQKGYFNVSINYRLEPGGCSAAAPTSTCIIAIQEARADAQTAVRYLRTNAAAYGIDAARIAIGGSSAGAITALQVGFASSEDPTAAVGGAVSLSGANLLSAIDSGDAPSLLFHGTADTVVPYQWAVNTWNEALSVGLDSFLTSFPGEGHVPYVQNRTQILDETTNFLWWELDLANATH
jgi:predicted esterase